MGKISISFYRSLNNAKNVQLEKFNMPQTGAEPVHEGKQWDSLGFFGAFSLYISQACTVRVNLYRLLSNYILKALNKPWTGSAQKIKEFFNVQSSETSYLVLAKSLGLF